MTSPRPAYLFQDPGLRQGGLAAFGDDGKLLKAWLVKSPAKPPIVGAQAWEGMARQVRFDVRNRFDVGLQTFVSESMVVRDPKHQKGRQEDIMEVQGVVGTTLGLFSAQGVHVESFKPEQWKGQTTKEVTVNRLTTLPYPAGLTDEEWELVEGMKGDPRKYSFKATDPLHNVLDAVALGVWYLRKKGVRK